MKILYGDGVHDDTEAVRAWYANEPVYWPDGRLASTEPLHADNPLTQRGRVFSLQLEHDRKHQPLNSTVPFQPKPNSDIP